MANAQRKALPRKDYGFMDKSTDLLEATRRMDLDGIKQCLAVDPDSIRALDSRDNNAMHICVLGGASLRAPHLMSFFVDETEIDLLQKNKDGLDPLRLAVSLNDEEACELIEPHWHEQLNKRFPVDSSTDLEVVSSDGKPNDPGSGPL